MAETLPLAHLNETYFRGADSNDEAAPVGLNIGMPDLQGGPRHRLRNADRARNRVRKRRCNSCVISAGSLRNIPQSPLQESRTLQQKECSKCKTSPLCSIWPETFQPLPNGATRIALDENELAIRWGSPSKPCAAGSRVSFRPVFCKLRGARHHNLRNPEAFERRVSRFSTFAQAASSEEDGRPGDLTIFPADVAEMSVGNWLLCRPANQETAEHSTRPSTGSRRRTKFDAALDRCYGGEQARVRCAESGATSAPPHQRWPRCASVQLPKGQLGSEATGRKSRNHVVASGAEKVGRLPRHQVVRQIPLRVAPCFATTVRRRPPWIPGKAVTFPSIRVMTAGTNLIASLRKQLPVIYGDTFPTKSGIAAPTEDVVVPLDAATVDELAFAIQTANAESRRSVAATPHWKNSTPGAQSAPRVGPTISPTCRGRG